MYAIFYLAVLLFACMPSFKKIVILNSEFLCFFLIEVTRYLRRPFLCTSETKTNNKTLQGMISWISGSSGFLCREKLVTLLQM